MATTASGKNTCWEPRGVVAGEVTRGSSREVTCFPAARGQHHLAHTFARAHARKSITEKVRMFCTIFVHGRQPGAWSVSSYMDISLNTLCTSFSWSAGDMGPVCICVHVTIIIQWRFAYTYAHRGT